MYAVDDFVPAAVAKLEMLAAENIVPTAVLFEILVVAGTAPAAVLFEKCAVVVLLPADTRPQM